MSKKLTFKVFVEDLENHAGRQAEEAFLAAVRPVVAASACGGGCAVAAVTVAAGTDGDSGELRQVAGAAFTSWADQLAERFGAAGLAPAEAAGLAGMLLALLEGAHVLCRAAGDLEPFDHAAGTAIALTRSRYPDLPRQ